MKAVARSLTFKNPMVLQGMYIFKNPRIGGEGITDLQWFQLNFIISLVISVTPHQDGTFLRNDPLKLVGYWFPIDDATLDNGCLEFVPGSHKKYSIAKQFVRNPMWDRNDPTTTEQMLVFEGDEYPDVPDEEWVPAPCKSGSLVLIHGQVLHRSAKNTSSKPRHAYTFHMVETEGCVYRKTNWLQPPKNQPFPRLFETSNC